MTDAILVSLAKAVATALQAATFDIGTVDIEWDFDNRTPNTRLKDGAIAVTVVVPTKYEEINRGDHASLDYVAAVEVVILRSFAQHSQDGDQTIAKDEIGKLVRLTEQMHQFFQGTLSESRLTLADHGLIAEWIDERDGISARSEISVAYSPKYLAEAYQYAGICREVFELTAGTA